MPPLGPRRPRLADPGYLAWLRTQSCACGCHQPGPCDAAHLRSASLEYDKPQTGMGRKPDDCWALPLKHSHHMAQHDYGDERGWWVAHGIKDPFALCLKYYAAYGGDGGKPISKRTPPPKRNQRKQKIPSRPFSPQKRSFR